MTELLWLLLPVAAVSGWYAARRAPGDDTGTASPKSLRSHYFKGINYLLNEQPDKAIEVFIKVLEVDSETVETHMALGNLYRRRGEVDRAIRIHQNLIARSNLSVEQRNEALLELGQDYMSAGLLDRAENLFRELVDADVFTVQALRQLIDIYEQEQDWDNAIESSRKLEKATGNQLGRIMAQYYCEKAKVLQQHGEIDEALALVGKALESDKACVRASLLEGDLHARNGDHASAVESFRRVEQQDPDYLPETVERMRRCFREMGMPEAATDYLEHILQQHGGVTAALALADIRMKDGGTEDAIGFLSGHLRAQPSLRGFDRLFRLEQERDSSTVHPYLSMLGDLTSGLLDGRPVYKCNQCGFAAKAMHWQCPGCKNWNTIQHIHGIEGE